MKATMVTRAEPYAVCTSCPKSWRTANALAVASQHAEREGHFVQVTVTRTIAFDGTAAETTEAAFTEELMFS